jgi:predicted Zn finger-like uncharacterized protein
MMITRCPICRTTFRVTPEQLDARNGKVRCGKCTTVFDAREAMHAEDGVLTPENAAETADSLAQLITWPESTHVAQTPSAAEHVPQPAQAPESEASPPELPLRRRSWLAGSALLALVLIAQTGFHFRGEIALLVPETRPILAKLCASLGCDLPLPRRAELMSIESSDLQADPSNPSVMVLTATLRNRAFFPQSHPSLELSLTDLQDQPLARRVLGPRDYLGQDANLSTSFPANSELPVKIFIEASSLKATGYRLYLFYP